MDAAVCDHLVSDVPTGVFLSSGFDSTVVAGVAARHASRLRSFTVGFAVSSGPERVGTRCQTAEQFGLAHTEIQVTGSDALPWRKLGAQGTGPAVDGRFECLYHLEGRAPLWNHRGDLWAKAGMSFLEDIPASPKCRDCMP